MISIIHRIQTWVSKVLSAGLNHHAIRDKLHNYDLPYQIQ